MPRIIDHDERRREIAAIVADLVYEHGAEALTIRDVAARAGCSTTIVSHYFRTKLEMLVFTAQAIRIDAEALLHRATEEGTGLQKAMNDLLPHNEPRQKAWYMWFAFWGMASDEPSVKAEWYNGAAHTHGFFEALIHAAKKSREVKRSVDAEKAGHKLQVIINGIASLWLQNREKWPAQAQFALMQEMLEEAGIIRRR